MIMMKIKALVLCLGAVLSTTAAFAIVPGPEVFLASVGRGQGACPAGVCAEWRTSVWVTNPSTTETAQVEIAFLQRGQANTSPAVINVWIQPGQGEQFTDIFNDYFHLDGVFGALRLRSNVHIAVNARTYDANVTTNRGVGSAGQDLPGIPFENAIAAGEHTTLAGLAQDAGGVWRSNFGMVEVMGQSCTVEAELLDGTGTVLATKTYNLLPFEPIQPPITDLGGPLGTNQRVVLNVTGTSGAIIAFGSLIDNTTGDPTTMDQVHGGVISATDLVGTWTGPWNNVTYGTSGTVTVVITVDVPSRTAQLNLTLTGMVFGGSPPPSENYTAAITPKGLIVNTQSAFAGTLTATYNSGGQITGQAIPPSGSPIALVTFFGYTPGGTTTMNIAYEITFAPSQGGGTAGGFCTLTKS